MKYDLQNQEQYAQEQIRRNPPFRSRAIKNAYTIEVERLRAENKELWELAAACKKLLLHRRLNDIHPVDYQRIAQAFLKMEVQL